MSLLTFSFNDRTVVLKTKLLFNYLGVKFSPVFFYGRPAGFRIAVRGTAYDFYTGKLNVNDTKWFELKGADHGYAENSFVNPGSISNFKYIADSTKNRIYKPYKETNLQVTFTYSNIKSSTNLSENDVGEVIPLFDAQPVTMKTAMPLNGIGLYYKGARGYGGYVAPRIFTDSIEKYLVVPEN